MSSPIFQKLFILVLGTPADTELAVALEAQVEAEGWGPLVTGVNNYLNAQAQAHGGAHLVKTMAMNGLGLELSDSDAAAIYASVSSGATTWANLLAKVILDLQGPLADTLANRAEAGAAFTAALLEQDKGDLYDWNGSPNLNGAVRNLLHSIGADDLTFEQGTESLLALIDGLSEMGVGGLGSDGRVSGATIYVDANGNGLPDAGEEAGTTGADGSFDVDASDATGSLLIMGGTDILSTNAFIGMMQAPAGATVITPLTSLAEAFIDIDEADTALGASASTTAALGLPPLNVLNYDPIAVLADPEATPEAYAQALLVERVSIQLSTLVSHITVALMAGGMSEAEASQAAWQAVARGAADGELDLTDADELADIITDAGVDADRVDDIATVVDALNDAAEAADNIVDLAKVAVVAGNAAEDLEDAMDSGAAMDDWVIEYTGGSLEELTDGADPGFLLPGIPVDGEGGPNLPPTGADATVSMDEDGTHTFSADDFGYSDVNDDAMAAVRIDALPSSGTLMLDGEAVTAGQVIAAEDLGLLTYEPAANASGDAYASIGFSVQDAQGAFDTMSRTLTIDVAPVNDEPTGSVWIVGPEIIGNKLFAMHDLADIEGLGDIRFEWFADGESLGKFGFALLLTERELGKVITVEASYTDGGATLEEVMSGPTDPIARPNHEPEGSVYITGDPVQYETLHASHDVTDEDGFDEYTWQWFANGHEIEGATGEDFTLTQDEVGKEITVELRFVDGRGNAEAVSSDETDPVENVNDAPTLTAVDDLSTDEDVPLIITYGMLTDAADEDDIDGDELSFRIETIEDGVTLEIYNGEDWVQVTTGVTLVGSDDELRLTFGENYYGEDTPAFSVVAYDGEYDSGDAVNVRVDVAPVNDAPELTDVTYNPAVNEDTWVQITFAQLATGSDLYDVETADNSLSFIVQDVASGSLEIWTGEDWTAAGEDTQISFGDTVRWKGAQDANGYDIDAFSVVAYDGELVSSPAVMVEVDVYAINDAPTLTTMTGFTGGSEDDKYYFSGEDLFAAGDEADVDGDSLSFRVTSVGEDSSLQFWDGDSWESVVLNSTQISASSSLRWTPKAEVSGDDIAAFTVVAWDGSLASSPAVQVTVDLAAGSAPVLSDAAVSLTSVAETVGALTPTAPTNGSVTGATLVSALAAETGIANVVDADDNVIGIAITNFDASAQGKLWYSTNGGTTWTEVGARTASTALLLDNDDYVFFKPNANVTGTISTVFTFKAWDLSGGLSGGTANTTVGDSWSTATDGAAVSITAAPAQTPSGGNFGDGFDDLYYGGSGNDTLVSGTGNDTLFGGGGDDVITSENGADVLDGGSGNDTINAGNDGDIVYGGTGDDSIIGGNSDDVIRGGAGNDTINGGNSKDTLMFEATAADNGVDSITTEIGNNKDIFSFPSTFVSAGIESGGGAFDAGISVFTGSSDGSVNISGKVALFSGGNGSGDAANVDTASEIAAALNGNDMILNASSNAVIISGGTHNSSHTAYVWYVVNDSNATVTASEVTLVATLTLDGDLADFHATNFAFYV